MLWASVVRGGLGSPLEPRRAFTWAQLVRGRGEPDRGSRTRKPGHEDVEGGSEPPSGTVSSNRGSGVRVGF